MPKFKIGQWVYWTRYTIKGKASHTVGMIKSVTWDNGFYYQVVPLIDCNCNPLTGRSQYKMNEDQIKPVPEQAISQYEALIAGGTDGPISNT